MKKLALSIVLVLVIQALVSSQPCLPEGIIFTSQAEIDNFQANYPNCTEIEGDVKIKGNDITNLNGLNVLTSIGGYLKIHQNNSLTNLVGMNNLILIRGKLDIWNNDTLTSLTGLENLASIGGYFEVQFNNALTSLMGLDNLTSIEGYLSIWNNEDLTSLSGLENLDSIGGYLKIELNNSLTSIAGLENVTLIGADLIISRNDVLTNLTGLENLTSIGVELVIKSNDALTNLDGLQSLTSGSISNLSIINNNSLATCEVECICNYLANPNGIVIIYNNAIGCNNPTEVANACGIILSCLPYGNYYFLTQSDIDDFQTNYPGCAELEGDVKIWGNNINNLNGLSVVTSIGGNLNISASDVTSLAGLDNLSYVGGDLGIGNNDELTSLSGLESLTIIEGYLELGYLEGGNPSLTNINGLDNLSSVGGLAIFSNEALNSLLGLVNISSINGGLHIGDNPALYNLIGLHNVDSIEGMLGIVGNDSLVNLSGLENIASMGGELFIVGNEALPGLSELEFIDAGSITDLTIVYNNSLASCEVQSICDYLVSPNGVIEIHDNAAGCNSQPEVEEACEAIGIEDIIPDPKFSIYPNPFKTKTAIEFSIPQTGFVKLSITDFTGRGIQTVVSKQLPAGTHRFEWNAGGLPAGMYFLRLQTNGLSETRKLLLLK